MEWKHLIENELEKEYAIQMFALLKARYFKVRVYPDYNEIFRAYRLTSFSNTKVVIIGQSPYHDSNADGLSFSCKKDVSPSLSKIYDVLPKIGFGMRPSTLDSWAKQGVLLLNACLTVEESLPLAHKGIGWETFNGNLIRELIKAKERLVLLLWGKESQSFYEGYVGQSRSTHLVIMSEHPAYAARRYKRWNNDDCFIRTNDYLKGNGLEPINW